MFGLFKKKDNGNAGSQGEKTRSVPRPGPWGEASILMDQGRVAEALEHFARTAIQTRDLSHMDMAERWLGNQALLDKAGEEAVCLFDGERDKILCVYSGEESPQVARQARSLLPRYMVPNLYHWRKALPHNPNGKIDRAALREEFLS